MMNVHYTLAHVTVGWAISNLENQSTILPFLKLGKYYNIWSFMFFPLVTHTLVDCQSYKIGFSLSWYFTSYIHRAFARGTTMIGFTFIAKVIIVDGGVGKIHVQANLGLRKNNLNKSHTTSLTMPLLVLAFAIGLPLFFHLKSTNCPLSVTQF